MDFVTVRYDMKDFVVFFLQASVDYQQLSPSAWTVIIVIFNVY